MGNFKKLTVLACLVALAAMFMVAATASAAKIPKVDNFIMFVDHSGSMAQGYEGGMDTKIAMAKELLGKMNESIPELGYDGALYTFAPFAGYAQPAPYKTADLAGAIGGIDEDYAIYGRQTPMGNGLIDLDSVLSGLDGKTAVIMFTDGASNIGADPVAQAQALYAKYGGKVCFHVVSYADSTRGQMVVDEIRALNSCTVPASGAALLADQAALDQFVEDVFFKEGMEAVDETIVFRLNFGFDKYQITDEMVTILEQAKMILDENPSATYVVEGWTDSVGTDAYNKGLSERRADSVTNWLVQHGISAARLEPAGMGESSKYDNATAEGRYQNRRVEIRTK